MLALALTLTKSESFHLDLKTALIKKSQPS